LFLLEVEKRFPNDPQMKRTLSLVQEEPSKKIRMAHLAIVGSHKINGVAALHSDLIKTEVFPEFYKMYPDMFTNVTNGVTPRRWLQQANPPLSHLITQTLLTDKWPTNLTLLRGLRNFSSNEDFQKRWRDAKLQRKERVLHYFKKLNTNPATAIPSLGNSINSNSLRVEALFDIQIKRIHEYKRQLLNILYLTWRFLNILDMTETEKQSVVPRVVLFGGKAAPGYHIAKLTIKLINLVGAKVNDHPKLNNLLKIIFVPNYTVSLAELLIPASDLSQHISTAGMEASGTSNMKFAINGGLILGTLDGANIEIREEIGEENMFIFGTVTKNVEEQRANVRAGKIPMDPRLERVIDALRKGFFGEFPEVNQLLDTFTQNNDYYLINVDWPQYLQAQELVDRTYLDKHKWTKMSIESTAGMGFFSSDRSIQEYAEKIWHLKASARPGPHQVDTPSLLTQKLGIDGNSWSRSAVGALSPLDAGSPIPASNISLERLPKEAADIVRSFSPSQSPYF